MSSARFRLLFFILLLNIPVWAQAPPSAPQPARDPQAVAVVQAAIAAMGGATAIGQVQGWTFLGQMEGRIEAGGHSETFTWTVTAGSAAGVRTESVGALPWQSPRSIFAPALLGPILLNQFRRASYGIGYIGTSTLGSQSLSAVTFSLPTRSGSQVLAQTWYFDNTTRLPATIVFRFPVRIGDTESSPGIVNVSDYRSVSGLLYPFRIVNDLQHRSLVQVISIQSVTPNAPAGGVQ